MFLDGFFTVLHNNDITVLLNGKTRVAFGV